jgi:hypothetical protein
MLQQGLCLQGQINIDAWSGKKGNVVMETKKRAPNVVSQLL